MNFTKFHKGIWFYGPSGSGKTFASNFLKKKIKNLVIVDGDKVRKLISFDLGYNINDRKIQLKRILGISKLIIHSNKFPICSTVFMTKRILSACKKNKILILKIDRNLKKIKKTHKTYKEKKNVVGLDIEYEKFKTKTIFNDGKKNFLRKIKKILK
mgnify:FL=1